MDTHASRLAGKVGPTRAGVGLALVGAVLLGVGIFQSTSAAVEPVCPVNSSLAAKFTYQAGTGYVFAEPAGNESVVTITAADASAGTWTATQGMTTVIVKGGPGSKDIQYAPASTSGVFNKADLEQVGGVTPDIESLQFCTPSAVNPSTAANGFNAVTSGDARLAANESEGPVAIGGSLTFDQYQVAIHTAGTFKVDPSDAAPTALLVRGKVTTAESAGQLSVNQGWVAIGDATGVSAKRQNSNQLTVNATDAGVNDTPRIFGQNDSQTLPSATRTSAFDFNGAFEQWSSLATGLSACPSNVSLAGANSSTSPWTSGDAYIYSTGTASGQRILTLTNQQLTALTSLTFRDGATPTAASPLVINVPGVPSGWNPPKLNGDSNTIARYVIWNFGAVTAVTINGSNELAGTVLLPNGRLTQMGGGNLVGAVYSREFWHDGGAELHDNPFNTTVIPCGTTPPTTTTVAPPTTYPTTTVAPTTAVPPTTVTPTTYPTTVPPTTYPTSSTSSSVPDTSTSSTIPDTTTSSEAPTTTEETTTTVAPTTSEAPTTVPETTVPETTVPDSTTSTDPDGSTTSTSTSTTSSTASTTSTVPSLVAGEVVVRTSITPDDDARVAGTNRGRALAWTGSTSLPMVLIGIVLLIGGGTMILVSRQRTRKVRS